MAQHSKYWSCSKLADKIRGTKKLHSGTSTEWNEWNDTAQKKHPRRYWIAEELLDDIQDFITWPTRKLYDIKYYMNNRWVSKSHAMTANRSDVKPGEWCDLPERMLLCLFNELVNFVEVELAWKHIAWSDDDVRKKYHTPWYATGWFRWRTWRCREAGIDDLNWQANLSGDEGGLNQAKNAKEILALYNWWTFDRKNRPDPYDESGWSEYCETRRSCRLLDIDNEDEVERQRTRKHLDKLHELEEQYRIEDEDMTIRLIRVKDALWT